MGIWGRKRVKRARVIFESFGSRGLWKRGGVQLACKKFPLGGYLYPQMSWRKCKKGLRLSKTKIGIGENEKKKTAPTVGHMLNK